MCPTGVSRARAPAKCGQYYQFQGKLAVRNNEGEKCSRVVSETVAAIAAPELFIICLLANMARGFRVSRTARATNVITDK